MAASSFASRGAVTMNTVFVKPMLRKSIHKKSASNDIVRETAKAEGGGGGGGGEEVRTGRGLGGGEGSEAGSSVSWVPHERNGIYYPKGQEKLMQDVPPPNDVELVHWFS